MARHRLLPQEVVHLRGQRQAHGLRAHHQPRARAPDLGGGPTRHLYHAMHNLFIYFQNEK